MTKRLLTTLVATALVGVWMPSAMAQNVAIVNGKAIPKARLEALTQQVTRSGQPMTPDMSEKIRDELINREIFAQEALSRGLDSTDDYKNKLDLTRQAILIGELVADFQKTNAVTDEQAKAEYDKFVAASAGKEYSSHHILVEKESDAKAIIAKLKKGAKFEDLAKKQSKDTGSGQNGGDLGWSNPGNYVKEFGDALRSLSKGKITETPVKTQFGYHVIRLNDVREAQLPKFEDVKPQIQQQLMQQKMAEFQEGLRKKAKVE